MLLYRLSIFFFEAVSVKAQKTSTMTSITLASPRGDRGNMETSSISVNIYPTTHHDRKYYSKV